MEGVLWKWTNYFSGWQPRWFVLDTGILSYYKSQDDVNNGCKGSIKMSVCDVNVHPTDNTRLDLIIPGEAHFYVKAATPQERQHWLVALGSSKACVRNGKTTADKGEEMSEDVLRAKKSELRLYCDLLMQQVHSVKSAIQETTAPELEQINDATSLLSATCDTFIATLEDCMRLANASAPYPNPPPSPQVIDSAIPHSPSRRSSQSKTPNSRSFQRSTSIDRMSISPNSPNTQNDNIERTLGFMLSGNKAQRAASRNSISRSRTPSESSELSDSRDRPHEHMNNGGLTKNGNKEILEENEEDDIFEDGREDTEERRKSSPGSPSSIHNSPRQKIRTMFSEMSTSFMDIKLSTDGGIPVIPFLDACNNVLLIFDKLNPTAFVPIKNDISGNIKKVRQKYSTDPDSFQALQDIIKYEVDHKQSNMGQSATVSLIWLKRAMMFIREFLAEVHKGEADLENCAHNAYGRTLREYHGIVIRGVFTLAAKSVPYRKDFLHALAHTKADLEKPGFDTKVLQDLDDYITAQGVLIKIIDDYYVSMDINPKTLI